MQALFLKYGYALLFVGVMAEGETFLLVGAFLARQGVLILPAVVFVAIVANSTIDQIYFHLARVRGRAWLERRFAQSPRFARLLDLMSRHARWVLLASRFAVGFRILIPAACGALGMPPRVFTSLNLLASVLWAVPTGLVGYYLAAPIAALLPRLRHYELLLALLVLTIPALVFATRQARRLFPWRELHAVDVHTLVPLVVALMGLMNVVSALLNRPHGLVVRVGSWFPIELTHHSRPLMLFAGLALLTVTGNLRRRKALAWWIAVGALAVSLVSHVGRGFDLHHAVVAAVLLGYLVVFRRRFNARSDPASLRFGLLMAPVVAGLVLVYGTLGLDHMRGEFEWPPGTTAVGQAFAAGIVIRDPDLVARTHHAARFLGSVEIAGWLGRLYVLVLLLRPVVLRNRLEAPAEEGARLFRTCGGRSLSAFAMQEDKHHLQLADGRGLVAYAVRGAVALACGDPLAPDEAFPAAVSDYLAYARRNGWTPCVYEAAEDRLPVYESVGLRSLKIAEEALVDLPEFSLAGGKRAALRSMASKVRKLGLVVQRYPRREAPDSTLDEQLEEVSEEWLAEKRLGELGFTLGRFSLEALDKADVFVCRDGERVVAFCTWLRYCAGEAAVVDLMRKRKEAVSGTMDLLLAEALLAFKAEGLREASLANAPLASVGPPRRALDRGVALLFERLHSFYGYKNLFQFKKKFAPRWEGRFLVYPRDADLPRVAYAMTTLHAEGGLVKLLFRG
jgi:phosphatidylglycerol lysyltransferase